MRVRYGYDSEVPFDVDPAEESHARLLDRIDADDARMARGTRRAASDAGSSSAGDALSTSPAAPTHLTEADMPSVFKDDE